MIAKFHSAPGHSMETTLTINIPPPERIRAAKGERLREKQKEKDKIQAETVQGLSGRIKDREKEDEITMREKDEDRARRDDREREREKLERERRALAERGTSYKDKFQKMREKYDKVTSTHETNIQELDILNEKIKKLQAEHDLLLDAVFLADTALYDRHFPSGPGFGPPPIAHPGPKQHPPHHPRGMSSSSHSYHKPAHGHGTYVQHPSELPVGGPLQRFLDNPAASSSGPSPKPVQNYYHPQSHGQNVELQEQSKPHTFFGYPSREPMIPDPIHPPAHHRHSQHSTYRHYVPPSDHHGMPPPPPPIPGSDGERERQREKDWERDRARREWEWEREREGRHPPYKEFGGLPPTPPLIPVVGLPPPSNGYNLMTSNGHGYVHGPEYGHSGHSLPPTSVTRTHARHSSRTSRSNPSRSASRRRNEGMKMEIDVDADMHLPLADGVRSLGGPIHLDPGLEVARKRERGSHSRSAEHDHGRRESRRSRRSSGSRKPTMGHPRTPPMGMLEPVIPEQLQPGLDIRHDERRQSPRQERERDGYGYDRSDAARQFGHATTLRASYEEGSAHPSGFRSWRTEDSDEEDYGQRRVDYDEYEQGRRHERGGRWGVPGGRIENSGGMDHEIEGVREEEEESDPGEGNVGKREVMVVDEAN